MISDCIGSKIFNILSNENAFTALYNYMDKLDKDKIVNMREFNQKIYAETSKSDENHSHYYFDIEVWV